MSKKSWSCCAVATSDTRFSARIASRSDSVDRGLTFEYAFCIMFCFMGMHGWFERWSTINPKCEYFRVVHNVFANSVIFALRVVSRFTHCTMSLRISVGSSIFDAGLCSWILFLKEYALMVLEQEYIIPTQIKAKHIRIICSIFKKPGEVSTVSVVLVEFVPLLTMIVQFCV